MTIRYLEIFVEVCKHQNMSKAAQSLLISQSSVSQAIASLEKEYEVTLFERLNHSLLLTKAGEQMLYLSVQVLESIQRLNSKMKEESAYPQLSIGACTTVGACILFPLIELYKKEFGNTRVNAEINNSKELETRVLNGRLDFAVIQEIQSSPYLKYQPFLDDELSVICSMRHPLAGKNVSLAELQDETFISREPGSGTDMLLKHAFASRGLILNSGWICNNIDSIQNAIVHNIGVAIMSKYLTRAAIQRGTYGEIHVCDYKFSRRFVLIWHKNKILSSEFRAFIDLCDKLGQEGLERLVDKDAV